MTDLDLDSKVTLRQAYFIMFEYLDRHWLTHNKPDAVGDILSPMALWDFPDGKRPMDASIFPKWLDCSKKVLADEDTETGYRNADIKLKK